MKKSSSNIEEEEMSTATAVEEIVASITDEKRNVVTMDVDNADADGLLIETNANKATTTKGRRDRKMMPLTSLSLAIFFLLCLCLPVACSGRIEEIHTVGSGGDSSSDILEPPHHGTIHIQQQQQSLNGDETHEEDIRYHRPDMVYYSTTEEFVDYNLNLNLNASSSSTNTNINVVQLASSENTKRESLDLVVDHHEAAMDAFQKNDHQRRRKFLRHNSGGYTTTTTTATSSTAAAKVAGRQLAANQGLGWLQWTSIVLGTIAVLSCLGSLVFVNLNRTNKVVTVGQPFFLNTTCIGALLIASSIYADSGIIQSLSTGRQMNISCIIELWLFQFGIQVVYMSLFCKLWRAEQVLQFRKGKRILVKHVLWPFVAVVATQIVLIVVESALCPPTWQHGTIEDSNGIEQSYETCTVFDDDVNVLIMSLCFALVLVCQIVVIWMSVRTRNIREDITDTSRIFQLMVCHLALLIPYALIVFDVIPIYSKWYVLEVLLSFFFSVTTVGFMIAPKMYYVWYSQKHGRLPDHLRTLSSVGATRVTGVDGSGKSMYSSSGGGSKYLKGSTVVSSRRSSVTDGGSAKKSRSKAGSSPSQRSSTKLTSTRDSVVRFSFGESNKNINVAGTNEEKTDSANEAQKSFHRIDKNCNDDVEL